MLLSLGHWNYTQLWNEPRVERKGIMTFNNHYYACDAGEELTDLSNSTDCTMEQQLTSDRCDRTHWARLELGA